MTALSGAPSEIDAVDGCAGPGGWDLAARALGLRVAGIELDPWACATRAAAGHLTVRADVAALPVTHLRGKLRGLLFSPPCGTFSAAGKGEGVADLPLLHQALDDLAAGCDPREGLRYALAIRPEWIALEQVPEVLPLWRHMARILRALGYSAWAGILNAANFGVPQTRQRAILIASRVRAVTPPEPTHAKVAEPDTLFGLGRARWVSMAQALGWTGAETVNTRGERTTPGGNEFGTDRLSWALTEKTRSWTVRTNSGNGNAHDYERTLDAPSPSLTSRSDAEPAPTLLFGHHLNDVAWTSEDGGATFKRPITAQEAAVLQSFPPHYPFQGTKTARFLQIGNAVPPLLAAHVLSAATGIPLRLVDSAPLERAA